MHLRTQLHAAVNLTERSIAALFGICAALLLPAACSTTGGTLQSPSTLSGAVGLQIGAVIETATGSVISMDELAARLSSVSVVYVGEMHTSAEDHKIQLALLQKLSQGGRCVELGMEMFPAASQPVLDRYMRGQMSEESFLEEVKWQEIWGFPYSFYRGLIDWQKKNRMPLLGLNAPNEVVRKIGREGLGSLTPDERSLVAGEFHLEDPANRERIFQEYTAHQKGSIKDFQSFFEAQLAWEETMAQTIAHHLQQRGANCITMVVIGKGHISERLGVPYLARIRDPHEYRTVAPVPINYPLSTMDPKLADFVVITDKPESLNRPRMGVTIQTAASGRGVEILAVLPGSPAHAAHLRKGDIILSVDGSPAKSVEDVQQALAKGGPLYKILVERDKKKITITVTIRR